MATFSIIFSYLPVTDGTAQADDKTSTATTDSPSTVKEPTAEKPEPAPTVKKSNPLLEKWILEYLSDKNLSMPVDSLHLMTAWSKVNMLP